MINQKQAAALAKMFNTEILPTLNEHQEDLDRLHSSMAGNENKYLEALRSIDIHIRSTSKPIPFIVEELKAVLPEWNEEGF